MSDPFKIDSPTCVSFSGGRTSAYMLWRVLQSNGGLPPEAIVCFANTGKEEEATLRFVRDCGANWNVPITWVEYRAEAPGYAVVDFETASRNGEPFEAIIRKRNYLPNPVTRFCTVELKILRAVVMSPDAPTTVIRKYTLTASTTRIVDTRTGKAIHGDDVAAVLDRGELEKIRGVKI